MKKIIASIALSAVALSATTGVAAQPKPEDQIKYRQAGYTFMSWNMGRIKGNLGGTFDAKEVQQAANVIAAIANSGMGKLFGPGTDKAVGGVKTHVKPELFAELDNVKKLSADLINAANQLQKVAEGGDKAAVQKAFGDVGAACKACHDKYKVKD